jgi:hypothetical protein
MRIRNLGAKRHTIALNSWSLIRKYVELGPVYLEVMCFPVISANPTEAAEGFGSSRTGKQLSPFQRRCSAQELQAVARGYSTGPR